MDHDFEDDEDGALSPYRTIGWRGNGARLKNYSTASKMGGPGVIKIEIETYDTYTMDDLVRDLERIADRQKKAKTASAERTAKAVKPVKKIDKAPAPLQLTFRGRE